MAGIYVHIPFCHQRCFYCDFYSTIDLNKRKQFVDKLVDEISLRKDFISDKRVDTIYFGGGTPSLIDCKSIDRIIDKVVSVFSVSRDVEITLESNPDDLTKEYLQKLRKTDVNRLSIGIQSFEDYELEKMNRRHNSSDAKKSVELSYRFGFDNISIDLIYGLPDQDIESWKKNLEMAVDLPAEHISAYHLTYEKGTAFYKWLKEGKLKESEDSHSLDMFLTARHFLGSRGFEHYEISNYAMNKKYSRHNTKYWFGEQYLGLGPSAHSYNGVSRQWNISNLDLWLDKEIHQDKIVKTESIDVKTRRNEMLMTRLRTKWGIDEAEYLMLFGQESWDDLLMMAKPFFDKDLLILERGNLTISRKGLFLSDGIISELFVV